MQELYNDSEFQRLFDAEDQVVDEWQKANRENDLKAKKALTSALKNNGILSIELNTVKDINNKYDKYNLVITVYSADDNHTKNNIENRGVKVEYEKEDLSQVNHQLHKWLEIVNEKSSKYSIPNSSDMSTAKTDEGSVLYNIGRIKNVGSYADKKRIKVFENILGIVLSLPDNIIDLDSINNLSQNVKVVNNNSMQDSKEYSMPSETDTDYTAEMDALDEQFKNGEIDRDQYMSRINELYKKAGDEYGTIPKGEEVTGDEDFDNPAPQSVEGKKKVRRHVRTIIEGGELTEEMLNVTKQQILSGDLSYTPTSNEANIKYKHKNTASFQNGVGRFS